MNIYVYSDESGVFDYINNDYFIFAGVIFLNKSEKDTMIRKFSKLENEIRNNLNISNSKELKANKLRNKDKRRLFNLLKDVNKFCVIVNQKLVLKNIFDDKKSKQRYLDYAFKIGLKNAFKELQIKNIIINDNVKNLIVKCDEHNTATNGLYELRENLLNEFKNGTFNFRYDKYFPPTFINLEDVTVDYRNSEHDALIRASDIIANRIYNLCTYGKFSEIKKINNLFIKQLP